MSTSSPSVTTSQIAIFVTGLILTVVFLSVVPRIRKRWILCCLWLAFLLPAGMVWQSLLQICAMFFECGSGWSIDLIAAVSALACTIVAATYPELDQRRWTLAEGVVLGLRLILIGIPAVLLLDPVESFSEEVETLRHVVLLLDKSDSMNLSAQRINSADPAPRPIDKLPVNSNLPTDLLRTRLNVAEDLLLRRKDGSDALLETLSGSYETHLVEFASTPRKTSIGENLTQSESMLDRNLSANMLSQDDRQLWSETTQLSNAIKQITDDIPIDQLSGVIVLTDGCDHSPDDVTIAARRLVDRKIPVNSVIIGDQTPVADIAITSMSCPRQVFEEDDVAIRVTISATELPDRDLHVQLRRDGEPIAERFITTVGPASLSNLTFTDVPQGPGVHEYEVSVDSVDGEYISENNKRTEFVWVSRDHLRLLLVEENPRWEYRYLRNLFAARDRSVALQAALIHPDRLEGVPDPPFQPASAARAFDDWEANALPESESEWLKFDVIILGDVSPEELGPEELKAIDTFVTRRGGTLIVIAGQKSMPHRFRNTDLNRLLPVITPLNQATEVQHRTPPFRLRKTTEGFEHPILQDTPGDLRRFAQDHQARDDREHLGFWDACGPLTWRHSWSQAKPGATVLAYAEDLALNAAPDAQVSTETQRKNTLIALHQVGAGRVLQMNFDQSWRLRYGVGDEWHHQFWGQIVRWAGQDRLAAGTDYVRLGTEQTVYEAGAPITVRARLTDDLRNPVVPVDSTAVLTFGDTEFQRSALTAIPETGGLLQCQLTAPEKAGRYRIELTGPEISRLLALESLTDERVFTEIIVTGTSVSGEESDVVASADVGRRLADQTNGVVCVPSNAANVLERLGPPSEYRREKWTEPLWNRWPIILTFLLTATAEWSLRRWLGRV